MLHAQDVSQLVDEDREEVDPAGGGARLQGMQLGVAGLGGGELRGVRRRGIDKPAL
jgi:hypothetical protein